MHVCFRYARGNQKGEDILKGKAMLMNIDRFISVGENLHCTRIYKVGGKYVKEGKDGVFGIAFRGENGEAWLPVPKVFTEGADWEAGKVKHCAVAIWQGCYGEGSGRDAGIEYLQSLARRQERAGATYLDVNVDEFSTDVEERARLMRWTVETAQQTTSLPMSIDSSNLEILRAGLEACDRERERPMVNSVSLERTDAIELAAEFNAVVIASAAGETDLPATSEGRLENLKRLVPMLGAAGFTLSALHVDPLVMPISVDGAHGTRFLEAVRAVRAEWGQEVHVVAGLSNVSFGMPNRKLINQVFTYMALEAGADGGIVDPSQINLDVLRAMDPESESFSLAHALLEGRDEFGMEYISACREGRI